MKKIGFIGAYDKTDLIINVAKIIQSIGREVLVVDATINQKARYIVPVISPTIQYVTEFEGIDVAVGFSNIEEIKRYLGFAEEQDLGYDVVMVDADTIEALQNFKLDEAEKKYFVTSFDAFSLKRGLEIFANIDKAITLEKVIFAEQILKEEDDYLNHLASKYKINWGPNRLYFPIENGDLSVIYENHRIKKIKFKKLSVQYKDGISYLAEEILSSVSSSDIRKIVKMIERGV